MNLPQNKKYMALDILSILITLVFSYLYATASVNIYPTEGSTEGWQMYISIG
jgi:hypothetical protein